MEQPQLTEAEQRKVAAKREEELERRKALVKTSPGLLPYGTPQELAEMVGRVRFMVPGGDKLKDNEIWALAQAAFSYGLNPVVGECWWLPGLGFMPGIRGLRRKGREQLRERDAHEELLFELITKPGDYENYKIPLGALAFFCHGKNSAKRRAWAQDAKTLREALGPDAPYEIILDQIGRMPVTTGLGYVTKEQMEEMDNPRWYHVCSAAPNLNIVYVYKKNQRELRGHDPCPDCNKKSYAKTNAMPHTQRAQKRAEAHFWKIECDLPFDIAPGGAGLIEGIEDIPAFSGNVIEGNFLPASVSNMTGEELERWREGDAKSQDQAEEFDEFSREEKIERAEEAARAIFGIECPSCGSQLSDPPPMDCPHCGVKGIGHKLASAEKTKPEPTTEPEPDIKPEEVSDQRTFTDTVLNKIVDARLAPDIEEAKSVLKRSPWASKSVALKGHKKVILWYRLYLGQVDRGTDPAEAARIATDDMETMA